MREILGPGDPDTVRLHNPRAGSPFLLIGDHAGREIPRRLGDLGVSEADRLRHIAWDIGVDALGQALSRALDAVFIAQTYSRLVIDCNRDPARPDAIPEVSDGTPIPGNLGVDALARADRVAAIHEPYQARIGAEIAARRARDQACVLVALHSFTPRMQAFERPWHAGVLHDGANDGFARRVLGAMRAEPDLVVGDNEPYRMDATDHTVPRHAFSAGLPYVELEIRQDLIAEDAGVLAWTERLVRWLQAALAGTNAPKAKEGRR